MVLQGAGWQSYNSKTKSTNGNRCVKIWISLEI